MAKKDRLRLGILKSSIREILRELRNNGIVVGYKEGKGGPYMLDYYIEIKEGKPRLKIEFIGPIKKAWPRYKETAYRDQVLLVKNLAIKNLKTEILKRIEARKKGWEHEDLVFAVAKKMIGHSPVISVLSPTKTQDQYYGIDLRLFFIFKEEQIEVPIQVKSSWSGLKDHVRRFGNKIPALVVGENDEMAIQNKLIRIAEAYAKGVILQI